jgi:hypothetical protein
MTKKTEHKTLLLDIQYLAPVQYYCLLGRYNTIYFERWEHYVKGTYRNRCYIAGHNGAQRLSIPLIKGKHDQLPIKDVKISYDFPWQHIHWQSLCTVYRSSPFFEFYEDDFVPFYQKQCKYLYDFNWQLMELVLKLLKLEVTIKATDEFEKDPDIRQLADYRSAIHPNKKKARGTGFQLKKYHQVFEPEIGFLPDMSIVDLLFNNGPKSLEYILE